MVNYNLAPVEVAMSKKCTVYYDSDLCVCEKDVDKITMVPLSVVMVKLEG